jgi:hypothetical protein
LRTSAETAFQAPEVSVCIHSFQSSRAPSDVIDSDIPLTIHNRFSKNFSRVSELMIDFQEPSARSCGLSLCKEADCDHELFFHSRSSLTQNPKKQPDYNCRNSFFSEEF